MRIPAVAATKRASAGGSIARSGSRTNAIAAPAAAERASSRQGSLSPPERTASAATSIAPCRRQAQPLEERGVDHDRDRHRDRIAPELVRPEKPRDEEPKREVQARVDEEGGDDGHGPIRKQACAARAPPCFRKASSRPGKNVLRFGSRPAARQSPAHGQEASLQDRRFP